MYRSLADRKSLIVLGMNSGTSADGLDLAAVRVSRSTGRLKVEFLAGKAISFPAEIRSLILRAADIKQIPVTDIILLDNLLGQFYGRSARAFIRQLGRKGVVVDAVASHGQTVRHLPRLTRLYRYSVRGTLQIGSPALIAAQTGCVTVADFRQGDIALGGEGAPITVAAMREMFSYANKSRIIVNVGGMSNYFFFPPGKSEQRVRAADCGPGNVLSDLLCRRLYREPFDRGGGHAARGKRSRRLLTTLLASPYFTGKHRSTGREEFGDEMADRMVKVGRSMKMGADDLLATALELTAQSIVRSVRPLILATDPGHVSSDRVDALYLTGGGSHNRFLCRRLSELLDGLPVTTVADLGLNPDLVEATAFAVMGAATLWSRPLETRFDGSTQKLRPVLGSICQPPVKK